MRRCLRCLHHIFFGSVADVEFRFHGLVADLYSKNLGCDDIFACFVEILAGHFALRGQDLADHSARDPRIAGINAKTRNRNLGGLGRLRNNDRLVQDRLGGGKVVLEQQWRKRQDVADIVESIADVVVRKIGRRLEIEADQIANRSVVLAPVEPMQRYPSGVAGPRAIRFAEHRIEIPEQRFDVGRGRARLFLRRHLAATKHVLDVFPDLAVLHDRFVVLESIKHQVAFAFAVAVAGIAVLTQERSDIFAEMFDGGRRSRLPGGRIGATSHVGAV